MTSSEEVQEAHAVDNTADIEAATGRLADLLRKSTPTYLLGAGCSRSAGLPLVSELSQIVLGDEKVCDSTKAILESVVDAFIGSESTSGAHIEDHLSEIIDHRAIALRRQTRKSCEPRVAIGDKDYSAPELLRAIDDIRQSIAHSIDRVLSEHEIDLHRRFVRAAHQPIRDGRPERTKSVDYIVLNYDTLIEMALAMERIKYADGLDGGATAWWNPAVFDAVGTSARVYKLHGSIDWRQAADDPLGYPVRIGAALDVSSNSASRIMIWPAETKYRETRQDPFAKIAEMAWQALRSGATGPKVFVTCGYSFGDAHVNDEILRCLNEIPDLTLVALVNQPDPLEHWPLSEWLLDERVGSKILAYTSHGFWHGRDKLLEGQDLDWWKFEQLTGILEIL